MSFGKGKKRRQTLARSWCLVQFTGRERFGASSQNPLGGVWEESISARTHSGGSTGASVQNLGTGATSTPAATLRMGRKETSEINVQVGTQLGIAA